MATSRRTGRKLDPKRAPSALLWLLLATATVVAARMQRELHPGAKRAPAVVIRSASLAPQQAATVRDRAPATGLRNAAATRAAARRR